MSMSVEGDRQPDDLRPRMDISERLARLRGRGIHLPYSAASSRQLVQPLLTVPRILLSICVNWIDYPGHWNECAARTMAAVAGL